MMEIFDSTWHVFSAFLVFLISLILSTKTGRLFGVSDRKSVLIYVWHTFFCLFFVVYTLSNPADSTMYYTVSLQEPDGFAVGTAFVVIFTSIFSKFLGFSYLGCSLVFGYIGYVGLVAIYGVLRQATFDKSKNIQRLALLCVFLPSVSFWSSAVGKDAISFLAVGLMLWAALNFKKRIAYFIFAIIAMLLVRPHIAAVMLGAYSLSFVFDRRISIVTRVALGAVSILVCAVMVPFALTYVGLGDAQNAADVEGYINTRQDNNLDGGSSVDISSMSLPVQLFTYLCRPLPFEVNSIFSLAASLDNVLLLLLSLFGIYAMVKKSKPSIPSNRVFLWFYLLVTWIILATTTANLGIAIRQKWMFVPMLMFLILSVLGTPNTKRAIK